MMELSGHHINSPSVLHRRAACPGSGRMEAQHPEEEQSEWAAEGTMLHTAVLPGAHPAMTSDQVSLVLTCRDVIASYRGGQFADLFESIHYELPMELIDDDGEILTAGTADCVIVFDQHVVIIDWKFGRGVNNSPLQTMAYAAMAMQKFGKDRADAVVFQPRVSMTPLAREHDGLDDILDQIGAIVDSTNEPRLVLSPSDDGCKYCRAAAHCPALKTTAMQVAGQTVPAIAADKAADWFKKATMVEKYAKDVKAEIKRMVTLGEVPGLEMKETKGRRQGFDPLKISKTVTDVAPGAIMAHAEISYANLEKMYLTEVMAADAGLLKKTAKEMFAVLVKDVLVRAAPSSSVVLVKGGE